MRIRLDIVFSIYEIFALAVIVAYVSRALALIRSRDLTDDGAGPA